MAGEIQDDEIARLKARIAELEAAKNTPVPSGFSSGFYGCFGVGVAIIVVIVAVFSVGQCSRTPSTSTNSATTSSPSADAPTPTDAATPGEPATPPVPVSNWTYREDNDELTGKTTKTACTTSTNEVQLDFPYHNATADLCIRKSAKFGLDAYVTLNGSGQILCSSYEGCSVKASFDKGAVRTFSAGEAADHSTNIIFITGSSRLITEVKKSKTAVIELKLYQAGSQDLTFKTEGLKWP